MQNNVKLMIGLARGEHKCYHNVNTIIHWLDNIFFCHDDLSLNLRDLFVMLIELVKNIQQDSF